MSTKPTMNPQKRKQQAPKTVAKRTQRQRRQKQLPKKGGYIFETPKQRRADPRMGANGLTEKIESENQIETIVQPLNVSQNILEEWARGFVMKAMEKGFQGFAESPDIPYLAYYYTVETMRAIIVQTPQLSVKVPYALLAVCRALQAKPVPFGNGSISYAPVQESFSPPALVRTIGFQPYGYEWALGVPTSTLVNIRFPLMSTVPITYDVEAGSNAFQRLCQILIKDQPLGPFRMVHVSEPTELDRDVSAFSYARSNYEQIGLTSGGSPPSQSQGGFSASLNLEVPIFRPQFGALGVETFTPATLGRFGNLHANCAGDPTFLACAQATWFTEGIWRMSRPPKLHCVDFYEFANVLAKWVSGMQQAYIDDVLATGTVVTLSTIQAIQCKLTLQEFTILLRNVMMTAFKETQAGVHGLYPIVPNSETDKAFVPFIVGANTCFLTPSDMQLPSFVIENIRALVARGVQRYGADWEFFIPVLGQWFGDKLLEANYFYLVDGTPYPSFTGTADIGKKLVDKESGTYVPLVETPINLIDGSSTPGFVYINDPNALKDLSTLWETWFTSSGLSMNSSPVGVLGTEKGINALTSINMTRVASDATHTKTAEAIAKRREGKKFVIDTRMDPNRHGAPKISSVYDEVFYVQDTSQSKMIATAYEQIQSVWILPCIRIRTDANNIITPVRWQAIMDEPYSQVKIVGDEGISLDRLHSSFAAKLVRSKLEPPNEWDNLFVEMAKRGRGGILSNIVGSLADAFVPGAGSVVRQIGGAIGV